MKKFLRFFAIQLALFSASAQAEVNAAAETYPLTPAETAVIKLFPKICSPNYASGFIDKWTGARESEYRLPTDADIANYAGLLRSLDKANVEGIKKFMAPLEIEGCKINKYPNVIFFKAPVARQLITFTWRVGAMRIPSNPATYDNPVDPLVIESPHTGPDGVTRILVSILDKTRARIIFMNGIHPKTSRGWKTVNITESEDDSISTASEQSDGAHVATTAFHRVHMVIAALYPEAFYAQIHGMGGAPGLAMLAQDGRQANSFPTNVKSGARLFGLAIHKIFDEDYFALPAPGIYHGRFNFTSDFPRALDTTANLGLIPMFRRSMGKGAISIQGIHLNRQKPGRFMHLENSSWIRGNTENSNKVAEALDLMMDAWVKNLDTKSNQILPDWAKKAGE